MPPRLFSLFALLVLAIFISLTFKTNLLLTSFIFFGIPAIFLTLRLKNKKIIPRLLLAALLGSSMMAILMDYLAFLNQAWYVSDTIFSFRIFDLVPLEDPIWTFLWIYLIFVFYESTTTGNKSIIGPRAKYWFLMNAVVFAAFFVTLLLTPSLVKQIPYYYLTFGILLVAAPAIIFLKYYPKYILPFLKAAIYIIPVSFAHEIVSLKLGHWYFPQDGKFVSMVSISEVSFPLEELVFFILIGSTFVLSYYEFFDGDKT